MSLQFVKLSEVKTIAVDTSENKLKLTKTTGVDHTIIAKDAKILLRKLERPT